MFKNVVIKSSKIKKIYIKLDSASICVCVHVINMFIIKKILIILLLLRGCHEFRCPMLYLVSKTQIILYSQRRDEFINFNEEWYFFRITHHKSYEKQNFSGSKIYSMFYLF